MRHCAQCAGLNNLQNYEKSFLNPQFQQYFLPFAERRAVRQRLRGHSSGAFHVDVGTRRVRGSGWRKGRRSPSRRATVRRPAAGCAADILRVPSLSGPCSPVSPTMRWRRRGAGWRGELLGIVDMLPSTPRLYIFRAMFFTTCPEVRFALLPEGPATRATQLYFGLA